MSRKLLVLFLVMMMLTGSIMAQDEVTRRGARSDAPAYGVRGAYAVGARDLVIEGETALDITVWYPALNPDHLAETITYPFVIKWEGFPEGAASTVKGHALADAAFDLSAAPYPLVILSPGFSAGRTLYAWLAEHLASHGFVVIAPEHHEMYTQALDWFWRATIARPQDILTVFGYVDAQTASGGVWEGVIDPQTAAVIGHSYGGYTALAAAGAPINMDSMAALCEGAMEAADPATWLCGLTLPYVAEMAALAGLDAVPVGDWPVWADPRVDAIVPLAGDAYLFDPAGLAAIDIPVMAIGGTLDTGTPYHWGTLRTYEHVSSERKAQVGFENAEHMIFASTCDVMPFYTEIGFDSGCMDQVWDMARAHDLINHFTTAFLLAELKGDADAAAALSPNVAAFPGIMYVARGF
jgi:predicted dienelactone hydrolase